MLDAARLVVAHGGSLSGEHGDGRARGELLPMMYSPAAIDAFAQVKSLFDPDDLLNPGVLVRPAPLDADLRRPAARHLPLAGGFAFTDDDGDLTSALHRCVGVGKCRADTSAAGGFMCPSFLASGDEKDVDPRPGPGAAGMANGTLVRGWRDPAVHESLDLCLSCKACATDCPAGVDMAQYKSEVLHRTYRRRLRPMHALLARAGCRGGCRLDRAPALVPARGQPVSPAARARWRAAAGIDPRRGAPALAPADVPPAVACAPGRAAGVDPRPPVVLWADSFTDRLDPDAASPPSTSCAPPGYRVVVPDDAACCGLTWITTGQLDAARRRLRPAARRARTVCRQGVPIVGLEPSCTAVLRSDLLDLLPDDPRATRVAAATRTLAEALTARRRTRLAAARPGRSRADRAAALPPARRHGLRHRPRPADRDRAPR